MQTDEEISQKAAEYVKEHAKEIARKFVVDQDIQEQKPLSMFMAGSPGAGKTEFSKGFIKALNMKEDLSKIAFVRIDADEVRDMIPDYEGGNAHLFQGAASVGVEKIHDYALKKKRSFVLDGTFANLDKARDNIRRSLDKGREVYVFFMYQDPLIAWDFTMKREAIEGRHIMKDTFVEQFFAAKDNIDTIKKEFGDKIQVWLIVRDLNKQNIYSIRTIVEKIEEYVTIDYTKEDLLKQLS